MYAYVREKARKIALFQVHDSCILGTYNTFGETSPTTFGLCSC